VATARVKELIADPKRTRELHDAIAQGRDPYGMMSFDQCLTELVQKKMVTYAEAVANATNAADFALHFRGFSKGGAEEPGPSAGAAAAPARQGQPGGGAQPAGNSDFQIDRFKE
jgi:Tfp pilus assembly ATPase PilU